MRQASEANSFFERIKPLKHYIRLVIISELSRLDLIYLIRSQAVPVLQRNFMRTGTFVVFIFFLFASFAPYYSPSFYLVHLIKCEKKKMKKISAYEKK